MTPRKPAEEGRRPELTRTERGRGLERDTGTTTTGAETTHHAGDLPATTLLPGVATLELLPGGLPPQGREAAPGGDLYTKFLQKPIRRKEKGLLCCRFLISNPSSLTGSVTKESLLRENGGKLTAMYQATTKKELLLLLLGSFLKEKLKMSTAMTTTELRHLALNLPLTLLIRHQK